MKHILFQVQLFGGTLGIATLLQQTFVYTEFINKNYRTNTNRKRIKENTKMIRKMITEVKIFIKECNSPEIKKLRQEAAVRTGFYNAGQWVQF